MPERTSGVLPGSRDAPAGTGPPTPRDGLARGLLRTARPRQWVKNILVLTAPAAAGRLGSPAVLARLAVVLVLFVCASAAVYLVNDALDVEADRAHPAKRHRPVASGLVPVPVAFGTGAPLAVAAPILAAALCNTFTACALAAYVVLQLLYCVSLKHVLVVDLAVVTAGFLLRGMAGGLAVGLALSRWFLVTAGFGALFMVAAKRYSELILMEGRQGASRPGASRALLTAYTVGYLRFVWQMAAAVAVLSYCLWAMEVPARQDGLLPWRQLSMVPCVLGVLRYAVFADRGTAGAPEDLVLRDRPLLVTCLLWMVAYGLDVAGV